MIRIVKAPAGYVASLHRDPPYTDKVDELTAYLNVTGKWCDTPERAVESLMKDLVRERKKRERALQRAQEEMVALLEASTENIVED